MCKAYDGADGWNRKVKRVFATEKPSDLFSKIPLLENRLLRDLRRKNHKAEVQEAAAADAWVKNISDVTEWSRSG